jgi:two-component system chemotaxis response regulator CheY
VLSNAGHESLTAGTTTMAWEKLQEHVLVDMVVLDNQLEQEWGWQFLRMLRVNPAYRGLPVIVYTAHTERSSIVKYVELGVQSLHVKPYKADVILAELKKALDSKWTALVMEPTSVICQRLGINAQFYGNVLATANRTIEEGLTTVRNKVMSRNDPHLQFALTGITQQCKSVGITVIDGVVSGIKRNIDEQDVPAALDGVKSVESLLGMIRHRMFEVMNMDGAVSRAPLTVDAAAKEAKEVVVPAATFAAAYARDIINRPFWQFGPVLKRLMGKPLLTPAEFEATTQLLAGQQPFTTITDCLAALKAVPTTTVGEAVKPIQDTPGFLPLYKKILERISGSDHRMDSPQAIAKVVEKEGVAKALTLLSVTRIAASMPSTGPLNLKPLFAHAFSTSITAFEVGRLLNLENTHMLAAAGLVHDCGRWVYAIGEPGIYSIALALAEDNALRIADVETALFGVDHREAGRRLLACTNQPALLHAAVKGHDDPGLVEDSDSVVTATVVHLARLLSQAAFAWSAVEAKAILSQIREPNYVAWSLLKGRGVELPFDTPELVDTLAAIVNTSNWTAHQILGSPA